MIQEFLKKYNIKAKKSLGQNFLVDENILNIISTTLDVNQNNILEIGPGYGALTEKLLAKNPKSLYLVELDKDMVDVLKLRITSNDLKIENCDFKIFNEDVLKFEINIEDYFLIANIPYYITSPILYRFLYDVKNKPKKMLILMQKDVGDKILQGQNKINGKVKSSVLSLFISKKSFVREVTKVPSVSFIPAPKVESSVLLFELHDNYKEVDDKKFLEFIKKGFTEPRKKLVNNLLKGGFEKEKVLLKLKELGFDENVRGEELNIEEWIKIFN